MTGLETILAGQGLMGAVCLALIAVCAALWKRLITVTDDRLSDLKSHSSELAAVARESARAMDGLTRVLEVKRDV